MLYPEKIQLEKRNPDQESETMGAKEQHPSCKNERL